MILKTERTLLSALFLYACGKGNIFPCRLPFLLSCYLQIRANYDIIIWLESLKIGERL